jgi:hypothetical protein
MSDAKEMHAKANEWMSVKRELKTACADVNVIRKRLKTIESDLVQLMTTNHTETVDVNGKTVSRSRGVGSKDI